MIEISEALAPVLVAAIRDAIKYNSNFVQSGTINDPTDIEEFLVDLGNLEMEVKRQYEKLEKVNRDMIPYKKVWPFLKRRRKTKRGGED